jgi:beta-lactamase class D
MLKAFLSAVTLSILLAGCSQNNVTEDDSLKQYFDAAGVTGSFGMFDNGQGHFTIYNLRRFRDSAYLPAATFDILQSLVGVQTGVVKDDSTVVLRDSMTYRTGPCSGNLTLRQAFRNSCTRAFQELARRIGKDTLKKWIDSLGYGNKDISSAIDTFWLDNHLAITSDEQLGLVKKLYFDQLPFFPRSQKIVRQMMLMESNSNYQLSYKTGTGVRKDGHAFTWIVGWVEENKHLYFFVMNLDTTDGGKDLKDNGLSILKNILKQMGFFQGRK